MTAKFLNTQPVPFGNHGDVLDILRKDDIVLAGPPCQHVSSTGDKCSASPAQHLIPRFTGRFTGVPTGACRVSVRAQVHDPASVDQED